MIIRYARLGLFILFLVLAKSTIFAQIVDCSLTKCAPIVLKIVKDDGKTAIVKPIVTTPLPNPILNIQEGQYPFGTEITFAIPTGLNTQANASGSMVIQYKWDYETDWTTSTKTILKNSGVLYVRAQAADISSEIKKYNFNLFYTRVTLVGNSMTQHFEFPQIGWNGRWGMAASAVDKDYKAILERYLNAIRPNTAFNIVPTGLIEKDFNNFDFDLFNNNYGGLYKDSDLIVIRLGENNLDGQLPSSQYKAIMERYIKLIRNNPKARVVITSTFWKGFPNTNKVLKEIADENGYDWVSLEVIGKDDSNYAYGLFTDPGVAYHPGDKGMKAIADLIYAKIK